MTTDSKIDELAHKALEHWGARSQAVAMMLDLSHLTDAIVGYLRGAVEPSALADEVASVEIGLVQLRIMIEAAEPGAMAKATDECVERLSRTLG